MTKRFNRLAAVMLLGTVLLTSGCQATLGGASLWARPAVSIPPRVIETGDGERIYMDGYTPRGDSMFIVIRVFPKTDKDKQRLTSSKLRNWPETIRDKLKNKGD